MSPQEAFRHCPRCGAQLKPTKGPLQCGACGFVYYFNPCCAVAGFVQNSKGEILWLRRAKDPAKGKLAVPGGFIDIGESAEDALRRESREEADIELGDLKFLLTALNSYHYQEITYPVLDLFFAATVQNPEAARPLDGVESLCWLDPQNVDLNEIAFPSIRRALEFYRTEQRGRR